MKGIREKRAQMGVTQVQLAALAGMDPATLNRIEQGKANPNLKTIERLADALEVEVGDFFPKAQAPLPLDEVTGDYQGWAAFVGELATDLEDWAYVLHGGGDPAELPEREFLVFVGGLSAAGATYQRVRTVVDALTQDEQLTRAWRRLSRVIIAMSTPALERRVEQLTGADELPDNVSFLRDVRTA